MKSIPFHKLYKTQEAASGINVEFLSSGNYANDLVHRFQSMGFQHPLLTDSCSRALEIVASAMDLGPGDEVIVPAYGYPTTADVFAQHGASIVFADSQTSHPNISLDSVKAVLTDKTKVVVSIHYGGVSTDVKALRDLCDAHNIYFVEDNAHGIGCSYDGQALGTFGHFSAISFHRTKNVHGFTGGMLNVNTRVLLPDCLRYYNKGTNRALFEAGTVPYYQWVGHGNSCEMNAMGLVFLWHQIQLLKEINSRQLSIWTRYYEAFANQNWNFIAEATTRMPSIEHNAHIYPLCFKNRDARSKIQCLLAEKGIAAYPHYHSLEESKFGKQWSIQKCANASQYSDGILRLPMYPDLSDEEVGYIITETLKAAKTLS